VSSRVTRRVGLVFLLAIVTLGHPGSASAQGGGERIRAFDADIRIEGDGSILVVERIEYDFDALERHGIYRDIPVRLPFDDRYDRVYPLEVLSVRGSPGTPADYETIEEGPLLRIKIGDPDSTITGRHTYTIMYRVEGALNGFPDHDELYWNAVGTEWQVPIERVTVDVAAPAGVLQTACFAGPIGSTLPCSESRFAGPNASFGHGLQGPFQGVTVVVGFPTGVVPDPQPILEERWSFQRAFAVTPLSIGLTVGLLLLLVIAVARILWVQGRDRRAFGSPIDVAYGTSERGEQAVPLFERGAFPVEYAPPDEIRPGQVGTLVDEVANPLDVTATIVDLAVRGYLRIEEIPKKGWFGKPDWRLVKLRAGDGLLRYEDLLLDALFEDADEDWEDVSDDDVPVEYGGTAGSQPPRPDRQPFEAPLPGAPRTQVMERGVATVKMSSLRKKFAQRLTKVQDALYADVVSRRWFVGRPDKVRESWSQRGFLVLLGGAGLIWLAAAKTHLGLVPIPIVLAGLLLLLGASRMPRRTAKGTGLVRRVLGFRTYIETAEEEEARFAEQQNLFSRYLPYAIVFGCTEKWARAFAGLADRPPTADWYVGSRPFTIHGFTSSIDGFAVTTSGTITARPAGSGSSGFGGGGSSGGGGGGGGGGSW
jgi:uncharacterized membrane protein YgcG